MKRRFTDIEKWQPWFRKLSSELKLFWLFIHDDCDEVGVWNVDIEKAEFNTGCKYDLEELKEVFAGKVAIPESESKWFILEYIELQFKELRLPTPLELAQNPNLKHSPAPRYINLLKTHGLWEFYQERLKNFQEPSSPSSSSSPYTLSSSSSSSSSGELSGSQVGVKSELKNKSFEKQFNEMDEEEINELALKDKYPDESEPY